MTAKHKLVWSDHFDGPTGSAPSPSFWRHEIGGHGWGNKELQTYTHNSGNAFQDGRGNLCIVAKDETDKGFTSARLTTKGLVEFQYGRFETRIKLPSGAGLWSAAWLLGANIDTSSWPTCGEIDVMEHVGAEGHRVFGTVHCPRHYQRRGITGDHISSGVLTDDFHRFAVDWSADEIVWSVDDEPYFSVTKDQLGSSWVFDHPFYVLLNLAVGGWLGGEVSSATRFPAVLQIDYVKVFSFE